MIVNYDRDLWQKATDRADLMPVYKRSMRGEDANKVGALGEIVVEDCLAQAGIPFIPVYEKTHDLVIAGRRVEVKTKDRTVPPRGDYECSVAEYNYGYQNADRYLFVSLLKTSNVSDVSKFHSAYVLGWCTKEELEDPLISKYWAKGDVDPSNGWTVKTSCINIRIDRLRPFETLSDNLN